MERHLLSAKAYVESTLREFADRGTFGGTHLTALEFPKLHDLGPHASSTIFFVRILMDGQDETNVMVKVNAVGKERPGFSNDGFFRNEFITYRDILPVVLSDSIALFPKFYQGVFLGGKEYRKDILVFENIIEQGFRMSEDEVFLDKSHMNLILFKLGQFHGQFFKNKHTNRVPLELKELKHSRFPTNKLKYIQKVLTFTLKWHSKVLNQKNISVGVLNAINEHIKNFETLKQWYNYYLSPEEPFAVLCHGDLNRNNIMFKYDSERPVSVKFVDLQFSSYSDPVADLSLILYANTDRQLRETNWDKFFDVYWKGLTSVVSHPGFTFEELMDSLEKKMVLALGELSYYMPCAIATEECGSSSSLDLTTLPEEELQDLFSKMGGSRAFQAVNDIISHMLTKNYFDRFLKAVMS